MRMPMYLAIFVIIGFWQAGDSLRAIARWLDGIGVTTRKGTRWHHSQIKRILERSGLL